MNTPVSAAAAPTPGVAAMPLPSDLSWPAELPEHRQLRGRDRWMDWALASVGTPAGFDPDTGKGVHRTTEVVAAPYPEHRAVVRLPKTTAFRDVIAAAQALSVGGDRDARFGDAQAVLQSRSGSWYITMAGEADDNGHVEPLPVNWHENATVKARQGDVVALVGNTHWANLSGHTL